MNYTLLGSIFLCAVVCAEEEVSLSSQHNLSELYAYYANLEHLLTQTSETQEQLSYKVADLSKLKEEIFLYKEELTRLKEQNNELQDRLYDKDKRDQGLLSVLDRMQGVLENIQVELLKTQQAEIQHKSRYQATNARVDNLSQQLEEVHRKIVKK